MMDEKYQILIIEDGQMYQTELVDTLGDQYELRIAKTGETALAMLEEYTPHLILLDIVLPDMNGFDLLVTLKNYDKTQGIPIVIITGLDDDSDEEKGLLLGAVDYIKKPFNHTIVRARINTQIQIIHHIQTIERLSFLDALTELPNRRKFDYQIEYEWNRATRKQTQISLLLLDLDNFKMYNDTYGHSQGDIMLQTVARVIRSTLKRSIDIPCRWGGEEFAILLPETGKQEAVMIAEQIRENIRKTRIPRLSNNSPTEITVSIGVATIIPTTNEKLSDFVETTDQLLYKAKRMGRNQVQF